MGELYSISTWHLQSSFVLQCIAAIACAEIPHGQWLEVVDILQNITVQTSSTNALKEQALETIGYICQDIVSSFWFYACDVIFTVLCTVKPLVVADLLSSVISFPKYQKFLQKSPQLPYANVAKF